MLTEQKKNVAKMYYLCKFDGAHHTQNSVFAAIIKLNVVIVFLSLSSICLYTIYNYIFLSHVSVSILSTLSISLGFFLCQIRLSSFYNFIFFCCVCVCICIATIFFPVTDSKIMTNKVQFMAITLFYQQNAHLQKYAKHTQREI